MKRAKKKPAIAILALFTCLVTATACHEDFFGRFCKGKRLSFIEQIVCNAVCPSCGEDEGDEGCGDDRTYYPGRFDCADAPNGCGPDTCVEDVEASDCWYCLKEQTVSGGSAAQ